MKIDSHIIFEIHRLFDLGYKQRKIARQLGISRPTVRKYLMNPGRKRVNPVGRPSKLDPYCDLIHQMLEKDPDISAPVVLQHLSGKGFDGKVTIIRDYLRKQRGQKAFGQAFLHIESEPAEQFQIDWGHFGHIAYGETRRKLYALAVVESFKVYKDFAVRFDENAYTAQPWVVGKSVTVKADSTTVSIYLNQKRVAVYQRSWERKKRIELPDHRDQVKKLKQKLWHDKNVAAFSSIGQPAVAYLKGLLETKQPIRKTVAKLLALKDQYGSASILYDISKAASFKAYGDEYIENILYQEMMPNNHHPPVQLKNEALNNIRLNEPRLADYDAYIIKRRRNDD